MAASLLPSETLSHAVFDPLDEGIAVFDAQKRLIFFNRAFEETWGLDPAFLQDRPSHAAWSEPSGIEKMPRAEFIQR